MEKDKNWSWVAWIILPIIIFLIYIALPYFSSEKYISIKYRDDKVDVSSSRWEKLGKSDSTVRKAWYDGGNQYMIINLDGVNYHYCGLPNTTWESFKESSDLDDYYVDEIKGNFDCRLNPVPDY